MHMGFDRSDWLIEQFRNLTVAQLIKIIATDRYTLLFRKPGDQRFQLAQIFLPLNDVLWLFSLIIFDLQEDAFIRLIQWRALEPNSFSLSKKDVQSNFV